MNRHALPPRLLSRGPRPRQRGVVLLFALISVLIVMIAAVALIRSFNSSLFSAGNIAFKRDLQNRSDLAVQDAIKQFKSGGALVAATARLQNLPTAAYSAKTLDASTQLNHQSIPIALQSPPVPGQVAASMQNAGFSKADSPLVDGVSYRYVIERLCDATGDEVVLGTAHCLIANDRQKDASAKDQIGAGAQTTGSCGGSPATPCKSAIPLGVVYRVSVRVDGPRNTLSFFQTTLTAP